MLQVCSRFCRNVGQRLLYNVAVRLGTVSRQPSLGRLGSHYERLAFTFERYSARCMPHTFIILHGLIRTNVSCFSILNSQRL
jgi:hypothetical protein